MSYSFPLCLTGGNGEPVATSTFPSVQSYRSCGLASCSRVGFDKGKMMGRSTCFAISCTTSLVKDPGTVDVPIRTWGLTSLITLCRSLWSLFSHSPSSRAYGICAAVSFSFFDFSSRPGLSTHLRGSALHSLLRPKMAYHICWPASSLDFPVSCTIASVIWSAIPVPAVPGKWLRMWPAH